MDTSDFVCWLLKTSVTVVLTFNYLHRLCDAQHLCAVVLLQLVAEPPKLAEYQAYIEFELKEGDPARIQITFERALAENCLVPDMWAKYTTYLVSIADWHQSPCVEFELVSHAITSQSVQQLWSKCCSVLVFTQLQSPISITGPP